MVWRALGTPKLLRQKLPGYEIAELQHPPLCSSCFPHLEVVLQLDQLLGLDALLLLQVVADVVQRFVQLRPGLALDPRDVPAPKTYTLESFSGQKSFNCTIWGGLLLLIYRKFALQKWTAHEGAQQKG